MKFAYILLLALTVLSVISTRRHFRSNLRSRSTIESPVYSMVISAKHYTSGLEKKDFFFSVPFSFNSHMTYNDMLETFDIVFKNSGSDKGFSKYVNEASSAQQKKKLWLDVLELQNGNKHLVLHTNLDDKYTVERIKVYQNQTFRDVQVKYVIKGDAKKHVLYVTFDFKKENTQDGTITQFVEFWKKKFPHATVVEGSKRSKKLE